MQPSTSNPDHIKNKASQTLPLEKVFIPKQEIWHTKIFVFPIFFLTCPDMGG